MAQRRMFSKGITESDAFLSMGADAQNLYFHLGMQADDDGFVSPKRVMRMIGSAEDSLKLLMVKDFVIPFESGVVVITDWKENNYLRNDRYKPTLYQKEMAQLSHQNGRYTTGIPLVDAGKVRIGKVRILSEQSPQKFEIVKDQPIKPVKVKPIVEEVFSLFWEELGRYPLNWKTNKTQRSSAENLWNERGKEQIRKALQFYCENKDRPYCPEIVSPWDLDTKWTKLNNFSKRNGQS